MEHLTKQQIILLALLVSFVSSIATGIVTVSLLDQSSPAVTQTINRVVEKTIQTVSPGATTTKEIIVVKEDEAITNAISRAEKSIVRIKSGGNFLGLGIILSNSGKIVAETDTVYVNNLSADLLGGNTVTLSFVSRDPLTGISLFQAEQAFDKKNARVYTGATLADSGTLKLGQSVVLIAGREELSIATGIISSKNKERIKVNTTRESFDSHAILVNLLGEVIAVNDGSNQNSFIPSNIIKTYATP
ncbi:MAG: serine protease [Patescibacteria group bacterium]